MKTSGLATLVLKAVGMALGIAVVVLNALRAAAVETSLSLLGLAVFALGLALLIRE